MCAYSNCSCEILTYIFIITMEKIIATFLQLILFKMVTFTNLLTAYFIYPEYRYPEQVSISHIRVAFEEDLRQDFLSYSKVNFTWEHSAGATTTSGCVELYVCTHACIVVNCLHCGCDGNWSVACQNSHYAMQWLLGFYRRQIFPVYINVWQVYMWQTTSS